MTSFTFGTVFLDLYFSPLVLQRSLFFYSFLSRIIDFFLPVVILFHLRVLRPTPRLVLC